MLIDFPSWIINASLYLFYFFIIILLIFSILMVLVNIYEHLAKCKYFISTCFYTIGRKVGYDKINDKYYFNYDGKDYVCKFSEVGKNE